MVHLHSKLTSRLYHRFILFQYYDNYCRGILYIDLRVAHELPEARMPDDLTEKSVVEAAAPENLCSVIVKFQVGAPGVFFFPENNDNQQRVEAGKSSDFSGRSSGNFPGSGVWGVPQQAATMGRWTSVHCLRILCRIQYKIGKQSRLREDIAQRAPLLQSIWLIHPSYVFFSPPD